MRIGTPVLYRYLNKQNSIKGVVYATSDTHLWVRFEDGTKIIRQRSSFDDANKLRAALRLN